MVDNFNQTERLSSPSFFKRFFLYCYNYKSGRRNRILLQKAANSIDQELDLRKFFDRIRLNTIGITGLLTPKQYIFVKNISRIVVNSDYE